MDNNVLFDKTIDMAARALDLRSRRHELIISNLSNADTPGYKAFDLMVEESLARKSDHAGGIKLRQTHPGHMPTARPNASGPIPKVIKMDAPNNLRGDGNTVDMDREMANLASNQLLYKVSAQIITKKFEGLSNVIKGGNK